MTRFFYAVNYTGMTSGRLIPHTLSKKPPQNKKRVEHDADRIRGKNRNSVAGLINRYRKKNDLPTHSEQAAQEARQKGYNTVRTHKRYDLPPPKPDGFQAVLERNGCRFIEGDIRDKPVYCEHSATHGAYCEGHAERCYQGKAKPLDQQ